RPAPPARRDSRRAPAGQLALGRVAAREVGGAAAEEAADRAPAGVDRATGGREHRTHVHVPERSPDPTRNRELEARDRAAGTDDAGELGERRARIVDVAEQVGERERVEGLVREGQARGARLDELDVRQPLVRDREHFRALVEADGQSWLALDDEGKPVTARARVREVVSIAALVEVAEETAVGGDLDELRSQLVALRLTENPPGIDEAEEAALALEATIGGTP